MITGGLGRASGTAFVHSALAARVGAAAISLLIGFAILGGLIANGAPVLVISWLIGAIAATVAIGALLLAYRAILVRQVSRVREASNRYVVALLVSDQTLNWLESNLLMPVYTIHSLALSVGQDGVALWTGVNQPIRMASIPVLNIRDVTVGDGIVVLNVINSAGVESQLAVVPRIPGRRIVHAPSPDRLSTIVADIEDSLRVSP